VSSHRFFEAVRVVAICNLDFSLRLPLFHDHQDSLKIKP
jgi:hypothetical protein